MKNWDTFHCIQALLNKALVQESTESTEAAAVAPWWTGNVECNKPQSMLSMKSLGLLPFIPACRAFVAASSQVFSDWTLRCVEEHSSFVSVRARWKYCWKQWRGRRKQKLKWRSQLEWRHQKIWRPIKMKGEQTKTNVLCSYEWVCRVFAAVLAFFEMLWQCYHIISALPLFPHIRSPRMCAAKGLPKQKWRTLWFRVELLMRVADAGSPCKSAVHEARLGGSAWSDPC